MSKKLEYLKQRMNHLVIKADHYSRSDWDSYQRVQAEMKKLDEEILDLMLKENETFLQNKVG